MRHSWNRLNLAPLGVALVLLAGCGDDESSVPEADAGVGDVEDESGRDAAPDVIPTDAVDTADSDRAELPGDLQAEPDAPPIEDLVLGEEMTTIVPPDPEGACTEGGNGARGRVEFDDGTPIANGSVTLIVDGVGHLGLTNEEGEFFITAPCGELRVEVAEFESTNYPIHPSLSNLPVGHFDATVEEPIFRISLVNVEASIIDVLRLPIAEAILEAELEDGRTRVYNEMEADEEGSVAVNLVPWAHGPYDLTARGPQDSDKIYRTATLTVIIGDPPPEPSTFILYEDRCSLYGTIRTSEGTPLDWLYLKVSGEPYPEGSEIYFSFLQGKYYERSEPNELFDFVPLWCGVQDLLVWNAVWVNPDWPCKDHTMPDQLCINNYPLWVDRNVSEPFDEGVEIRVVRVEGLITDVEGEPQEGVTVTFETDYQWGEERWDSLWAFNEVLTDRDGMYSMVVLPIEDAEYTVTTRIPDDDSRPLGEFGGVVEISEATTYDIELPVGQPRCALSGTVHSSEGHDHSEIMVYFNGVDTEEGEPLYVDAPWQFFSEESGDYYRNGFPEEEIPFVPMLCGEHDLWLHSSDWPSCNGSPDELCFTSWPWWSDEDVTEPRYDGIELPVVHVSGYVTSSESGEPISGVSVFAMAGSPFSNVTNGTGTDGSGLYDMVVLPGMAYQFTVSVGDGHPMNLYPAGGEMVVEDASELSFEMDPGPDRCPLSGIVHTSEGVELELLEFRHYGSMYGMFGWRFRSDEPGIFYRYGNETLLMDAIPLICSTDNLGEDDEVYLGTQTMYIYSRYSSYTPSCNDSINFDQPCLDGVVWLSNANLQAPITDIEIPVVWISGTVTLDDETPIQNAVIEASGRVTLPTVDPEVPRYAGYVSNYAVTRPDGTYRMAVWPEDTSEYEVTITTPLELDLGQVTSVEVISEDIVIDADFSSIE